MASVPPEQPVQAIVEVVSRGEKPLTLTALRKRVGGKGLAEALTEALRAGLIYEHPKVGRSRKFGRDPWRPEPRILELCGKRARTLADLGATMRTLPKARLEETVRSLMAESRLAPVHTFSGGKPKRGRRVATPSLCRQILDKAIQDLMSYYQAVGVKPEAAEQPLVRAQSDEEAVEASLRSLETREAVAVVIGDVRRQSGLPKERFDQAVLGLSRKGRIVLHEHDAPFLISAEKRTDLVVDGEGRYYVGISWTYSG